MQRADLLFNRITEAKPANKHIVKLPKAMDTAGALDFDPAAQTAWVAGSKSMNDTDHGTGSGRAAQTRESDSKQRSSRGVDRGLHQIDPGGRLNIDAAVSSADCRYKDLRAAVKLLELGHLLVPLCHGKRSFDLGMPPPATERSESATPCCAHRRSPRRASAAS